MNTLHPMLQPFKPSSDDPFDHIKAAHLLNRAGFGGTEKEIDQVLRLGPQKAADWLLDFPNAPAEEQSQKDVPDLSVVEGYPGDFRAIREKMRNMSPQERKEYRQMLQRANRQAIVETASWWLKRMAYGSHPLQEKLTLFWHGHFTTSAREERSATLMWNQNELLRRNAAGNFRTFVREISRDPAMLDYLNNQQNRKAHPNENYARELMELFTLGIGNYTEHDIRESARSFTGWAHDGDDFIFRKNEHDTGQKTFMEHTGNFDGDDIIEIILQQPACPRYIASRLWEFFAYESAEQPIIDHLAAVLKDNKWELRPVLRAMLTSKAFYGPRAIGAQIKSPIQLVVGTVRILGLDMPQSRIVGPALNQMGQVPLEPPNVKGWPGGRAWINTSTLFVRYNTGVWLAGGSREVPMSPAFAGKKSNMRMRNAESDFNPPDAKSATATEVVDAWVARLIHRPIGSEKKRILIDALDGRPDDERNVKKMVQLILSMPEYQLC